MQKKIFLFMILPLFLIIPVFAQEPDYAIPSWIKVVATAWGNGDLNDSEYRDAMIFLIEADIIKINPTSNTAMSSTAMELEIEQKKNRISILENEVNLFETTKSKLLVDVKTEKEVSTMLQTSLTKSQDEFDQYKKDYPLKIGNIGGKLVVDYIKELEDEIKQLKK